MRELQSRDSILGFKSLSCYLPPRLIRTWTCRSRHCCAGAGHPQGTAAKIRNCKSPLITPLHLDTITNLFSAPIAILDLQRSDVLPASFGYWQAEFSHPKGHTCRVQSSLRAKLERHNSYESTCDYSLNDAFRRTSSPLPRKLRYVLGTSSARVKWPCHVDWR